MKSFLFLLAATLATSAAAGEVSWMTDFEAAKVAAQKSGRPLLIDFTGSDWCPSCHLLERQVFKTSAFEAFASKVILVRVDFPHAKPLPAPQKAQNLALGRRYRVDAFPTVILADAKGAELARTVGYDDGSGPDAWLRGLMPKPSG
jgi:protein disulfide-isomerase